ncbi:MAG: PAS domain-containing protein, partial [Geobacteraceae bacterium]
MFSYSYSSDIWPALITLALTIFLGAYSWRRRHIPAAKPFTIACFFGGFWTLGVILELSAVSFSAQVFWVIFQAIWQLPVAAVITCFVLQYAGLGRWLTPRNYVLMSLFPLLCVLLMVTNGFHHLIWTEFRINGHVTASSGRLFWVFISYGYLLGLFNFVILFRLAVISPRHRWPVAIMLVSQMIARVGYTMDKLDTGLIGPGESVLLVVGVVSVAYAVAFLRFHAIDPVVAARNAALQQMREGLIVLDLQGRIADVNPMAAVMLGLPEHSLQDKLLEDLMPFDTGDLGRLEKKEIEQTEIIMGEKNSARQYTLNLTVLRERHGEVIGKLILLHDVTEQRLVQTRILEQQRVVATLQERERLARELHDGIGQTLGYVGLQAQSALKWLHDGNNEKAESLLGRLVEVAKDAHADVRESILCLKIGSGQEWSFIPALKEYMDRFQANYGIRTDLSLASGIDGNTFDPAAGVHLLRAIQEALTNARKHSEGNNFRVCMERNGSMAQVAITDDGHGFDTSRLERMEDGHFGLIFMRERMAQIGG